MKTILATPLVTALLISLSAAAAAPATSAQSSDSQAWRPLFNGQDLTGWIPLQVAPNTFTAKDGVIYSTGLPTGFMRTERQYENFVIEMDWMHEKPKGNAGLFLWGAPMTAQGTPFESTLMP